MRKAQVPPLAATDTVLDGLRLMLAESLDHLGHHLVGCRSGDVEAIHQARVALRRARSSLRLFRRVLDPVAHDGFNDALRTMGRTLGDARDWDVFVLETIPRIVEAAPDQHAVLTGLADAARRPRDRAHLKLRATLDDPQTDAVLHDLRDWSGDVAAFVKPWKAETSLEEIAPALLDWLVRTVLRHGHALDRQDDEQRHELRKSLKRLRYGIEMLDGLHAHLETRPYAKVLRGLQEDLGALNDATAAVDLVDRLPDGPGQEVVRHWSDAQKTKALLALPVAWAQFAMMPTFW